MSEYSRDNISVSSRCSSSLSMRSSTPLEPIPTTPRSNLGNTKVIPPIILCEKDRIILGEINDYIEKELSYIDLENTEQVYVIYKDAFDKLIDYVADYKPMLTRIKQEYENLIGSIETGNKNSVYLSSKLKGLATAPTTLSNYKKRIYQLEENLEIVDKENETLQKTLDELKEKNRIRSSLYINPVFEENEESSAKEEVEVRCIPGLSLEESTNIESLLKELKKKEDEFDELQISNKTRYTKKEKAAELKSQLQRKTLIRDDISEDYKKIKQKNLMLQSCLQACTEYFSEEGEPSCTLSRYVLSALKTTDKGLTHGNRDDLDGMQCLDMDDENEGKDDDNDDDDDEDHEAENMVTYIEKFSELLNADRIEEAALHAANSPKAILRTIETLNRFKDVKATQNCPHPLLSAVEAFMTVTMRRPQSGFKGRQSNDHIAVSHLAVVECLRLQRFNLISFWITQNRLFLTEQIGDLLFDQSRNQLTGVNICADLCICVYSKLALYSKCCEALMSANRWIQAIDTIKDYEISKEEITRLFKLYTNHQFFTLIMDNKLLDVITVSQVLIAKDELLFLINYLDDFLSNEENRLNDLILAAEMNEEENKVWQQVIDRCEDTHEKLALHLYSANVVRTTMTSARRRLK